MMRPVNQTTTKPYTQLLLMIERQVVCFLDFHGTNESLINTQNLVVEHPCTKVARMPN